MTCMRTDGARRRAEMYAYHLMALKAKEELAGFVRSQAFYTLGFRDKQWAISIVRCKQMIVGQPTPKVLEITSLVMYCE